VYNCAKGCTNGNEIIDVGIGYFDSGGDSDGGNLLL
jgi:hypothetical protein